MAESRQQRRERERRGGRGGDGHGRWRVTAERTLTGVPPLVYLEGLAEDAREAARQRRPLIMLPTTLNSIGTALRTLDPSLEDSHEAQGEAVASWLEQLAAAHRVPVLTATPHPHVPGRLAVSLYGPDWLSPQEERAIVAEAEATVVALLSGPGGEGHLEREFLPAWNRGRAN